MSKANWRDVIIFTLLAYGVSWLWWGVTLYPFLGQLSLTQTPTGLVERVGMLGLIVGDFGPLIAAVIMRLFISKEGLKGSLGLSRSWKYYLIALVAPPVFYSIVILFNHLTAGGTFVWTGNVPDWPPLPLWAYYLALIVNTAFATLFVFGEEYGWRGYLLPRLLPLGQIKATVIVGLIWSFWHLPLLFAGFAYPGPSQNPLLAILVFTFTILFLSFPFTWFYVATRGSVVLASLLHGSVNSYGDNLTAPALIPNGNQMIVGTAGLVAGVFLMVIVLIVHRLFKRPQEVRKVEGTTNFRQEGT